MTSHKAVAAGPSAAVAAPPHSRLPSCGGTLLAPQLPHMTDLDKARSLVASAKRLVVFTGAGVSADSGVPTFRGSGDNSFWTKYSPEELATPEGFRADPQLVYDFYTWRRTQLAAIQPNPAHHAIARWQRDHGAVVITQNVDGLHERLAPPSAAVFRLHGSLAEDKCSLCEHVEKIDLSSPPPLRPCPNCATKWNVVIPYLRPNVVFFGEPLDPEIWAAAENHAAQADVMLVVGTSGEVWPAAGLVHLAARHAQVIIANLDPSPLDSLASLLLPGRAAEVLHQIENPQSPANNPPPPI